jgi:hypothetical protein
MVLDERVIPEEIQTHARIEAELDERDRKQTDAVVRSPREQVVEQLGELRLLRFRD